MSPHSDRPHPTRSLFILSLGALAFALAQTMLIPALGELTHQLDTDASGIAWVLTGYLLAAAVATPIAGRLGDMFGKRRLLVASLGVFAFGLGSPSRRSATRSGSSSPAACCRASAAASSRSASGSSATSSRARRSRRSIGMISAIFGIGGGAGLIGGGLIADNLSYHWIFWVGAISAALAALATWTGCPSRPSASPAASTCPGPLCSALGLTMPLLAISRANAWGWGSAADARPDRAPASSCSRIWVAVERNTYQPLADIPTLLDPPVAMTNIVTLFVGFGMFGSFLLIPQLAEAARVDGLRLRPRRHRRRAAAAAGLARDARSPARSPASSAPASAPSSRSPAAPRSPPRPVRDRARPRQSELAVIAWNIVISIGIGLAFAAMANLIVEAVPPRRPARRPA